MTLDMTSSFEYKGDLSEWDPRKEARNLLKHGIDFRRAASFLQDGEYVFVPDLRHSTSEERWVALGVSAWGRTLAVCLTWRETASGKSVFRLISAHEVSPERIAVFRRSLLRREISV